MKVGEASDKAVGADAFTTVEEELIGRLEGSTGEEGAGRAGRSRVKAVGALVGGCL
jgi:hypothetical protein